MLKKRRLTIKKKTIYLLSESDSLSIKGGDDGGGATSSKPGSACHNMSKVKTNCATDDCRSIPFRFKP